MAKRLRSTSPLATRLKKTIIIPEGLKDPLDFYFLKDDALSGGYTSNIYYGITSSTAYTSIELGFNPRVLIYASYYSNSDNDSSDSDYTGIRFNHRQNYEYRLTWYLFNYLNSDLYWVGRVIFGDGYIQIKSENYYTLGFVVIG